jgi:hypothetical protein
MVNWHDPVLVLRDYRAFPPIHRQLDVALTTNRLLVALIKLDHALAGIYMYVHPFYAGEFALISYLAGRLFSRWVSSWTSYEVNCPTDGQYG